MLPPPPPPPQAVMNKLSPIPIQNAASRLKFRISMLPLPRPPAIARTPFVQRGPNLYVLPVWIVTCTILEHKADKWQRESGRHLPEGRLLLGVADRQRGRVLPLRTARECCGRQCGWARPCTRRAWLPEPACSGRICCSARPWQPADVSGSARPQSLQTS